ncbi:MAG: sugar phosphate isomerase/epimerase family protein [Pseudomonadales bacterium]
MQRRAFLGASAGSLLLPALVSGCQQSAGIQPGAGAASSQTRRLDAFGLQLSTVTNLMLTDFEGTLAQVAEIGYKQVEFSAMGFLGRSATQVQSRLNALNLEAPVGRVAPIVPPGFFSLPRKQAMQIYFERGSPQHLLENVAQSLDSALALGQGSLILPALLPDNFKTMDQVKRNIDLISEAGALCSKQGVVFGYHNHNWELTPIDGVVPYDLMLEQTDPDQVTFQLDAYWIKKGGGDLSAYLSRYPGRFSSCHMKDIDAAGDFADVGDGLIDFPRFTREAIAQGARHFFVERDNPPQPLQSVKRSYSYLQQMTF